jgi:hypothetical protein
MSNNSYLKDLILLRNDPSKVGVVRDAAERGEVDAQYALGLIYAEGRGVPIDLAQAHYWLSLAIEQGDSDADLLRNIIGSQMTEEEYQAAKRLRAGASMRLVDLLDADLFGERASKLNHHARSEPQPEPMGTGACGRQSGLSAGHLRRTCMCASCPHQGRSLRNHLAPFSCRQSARLMPGFTKIRSTAGSCAAVRSQEQLIWAEALVECKLVPGQHARRVPLLRRAAHRLRRRVGQREPDVRVESVLVADMGGTHAASARLRQVAHHDETAVAPLHRLAEVADQPNRLRMAVVAVAMSPDAHEADAARGQRLGAVDATVGRAADGPRLAERYLLDT